MSDALRKELYMRALELEHEDRFAVLNARRIARIIREALAAFPEKDAGLLDELNRYAQGMCTMDMQGNIKDFGQEILRIFKRYAALLASAKEDPKMREWLCPDATTFFLPAEMNIHFCPFCGSRVEEITP